MSAEHPLIGYDSASRRRNDKRRKLALTGWRGRPPSAVSYRDPLRTSVDRGGPDCPIWPVAGQAVSRAETLHRIPACITMHRRDPAKLPGVCRDPPACEVSHTAAKGVE